MAREFHFVVVYNDVTGQFTIDDDTANARFDEGVVYNIDTDEWEDAYGNLPETERTDAGAHKELERRLNADVLGWHDTEVRE